MTTKCSLAIRNEEDSRAEGATVPSTSVGALHVANDAEHCGSAVAIPPAPAPVRSSYTQPSSSDPALVKTVIASPQQIQQARDLREQIKRRYLNRDNPPLEWWAVGVD